MDSESNLPEVIHTKRSEEHGMERPESIMETPGRDPHAKQVL